MATDHDWLALRAMIERAFEDQAVVSDPPSTATEWSYFGDTLCDILSAEVRAQVGVLAPAPTKPRRWRDRLS